MSAKWTTRSPCSTRCCPPPGPGWSSVVAKYSTYGAGSPRRARVWKHSPSKPTREPKAASQSRSAFSSIASNTGVRSPGEELMTCNTSAVAVCCSNASRVSVISRVFSIAITACAAKFCSSAICLSVNGLTSWRWATIMPRRLFSLRSGTISTVRTPPSSKAARAIGSAASSAVSSAKSATWTKGCSPRTSTFAGLSGCNRYGCFVIVRVNRSVIPRVATERKNSPSKVRKSPPAAPQRAYALSNIASNNEAAARFHAQPMAKKLALKVNEHNIGYLPISDAASQQAAAQGRKPSQNEAYFLRRERTPDDPAVVTSRRFHGLNQWPDDLPGFRATTLEYMQTLEALCRRLAPLYAMALDLPADFFDACFDVPHMILRMSRYPVIDHEDETVASLVPHTDSGFMTLLPPNPVPGLSILLPNGRWIDAPGVDGAFVVNGGDILHRWTNERFLSTPHRVRNL